ncbi:MAG: DUF2130 domain-containing protein [Gammaproteobacteria bacterium]|nr:DUF2130 domain-containing protein [Gammaproteobacteria bacterium]
MNQASTRIQCPNCGESIDVNDVLYHQLDDELRRKYADELAREKKRYAEQAGQLEQERQALARDKAELDRAVTERVSKTLAAEREILNAQIRRQVEDEQAARLKTMAAELDEKSAKVKQMSRLQAELERTKRESEEAKADLELETEKRVTERLANERARIRKDEENRISLQLAERDTVINQLKTQMADLQRKAEQGSSQLQGEVLELAVEDWLRQEFPLDTIEEIKKGAQGADCLQVVNEPHRPGCGSIYYETKRTKHYQPAWIEKFKADIRDRRADIGVLVTEAMPPDMERMGMRDGIWICTFNEFKGLSVALRESLVILGNALASQENKGDKMVMLYDFLTGNEFRLQIEAIVEGFSQMEDDLRAEKRAMLGIWKKREKQIEKVLLNTSHMYNAIRGIAGTAIQAIPRFELPAPDDDDPATD